MATYHGVVKNGIIVLSDDVRLPDGTVVEVRVITPSERGRISKVPLNVFMLRWRKGVE